MTVSAMRVTPIATIGSGLAGTALALARAGAGAGATGVAAVAVAVAVAIGSARAVDSARWGVTAGALSATGSGAGTAALRTDATTPLVDGTSVV